MVHRLALAALAAFLAAGVAHASGHKSGAAPELVGLRIDNGATPFAGDSALLTTVSPNYDGFRDVQDPLPSPGTGRRDDGRDADREGPAGRVYTLTETLGAGAHTMVWAPADTLNPRTYLIRMTVVNKAGKRTVYGSPDAFVGRHPRGPVVRIQGIDAGFARPNYAPGQLAALHIATDEPSLELKFFQSGPEKVVTYADNQFAGVDADQPPIEITMTKWRSKPRTIFSPHPDLPSGSITRRLPAPTAASATRRSSCGPPCWRDEPRPRRSADEHVAGLQLPGRRRERVRRHLVRRPTKPRGQPVTHLHRPRRAAALLPLRLAVPPLAVLVGQVGGVHLRLRLRPDRERRRARERLRPDRVRGSRGVRDRRTSTTSCSATATLAGT